MTYTVKEIYKTIQGEGALVGRVAVFCRFVGCNLWSGREQDRSGAICNFCDTDFLDGKRYQTAEELADAILEAWGDTFSARMVVFTGGEPALQFDKQLQKAMRERLFYIAIETNGTVELAAEVDWICISPKAKAPLKQLACDELKVVYPQLGLEPDKIMAYPRIKSVQPMDGPNLEINTQLAIAYCLRHPDWRLSLQMHKILGIP